MIDHRSGRLHRGQQRTTLKTELAKHTNHVAPSPAWTLGGDGEGLLEPIA